VTPVRSYREEEARALGLLGPEGADPPSPAPSASATFAAGASTAAKRTLDTLRAWTVRG
jgi:hypothetical protein